jgi:hypothetical protein
MARINARRIVPAAVTHEGAPAARITPWQQLRRSVLSCMLWEDEFYEDGQAIAARIAQHCAEVPPEQVASLAIEVRQHHHLRHVPLLMVARLALMARGGSLVSETLDHVIQRADEPGEFLSIYAKLNGVAPTALKPKLSNQVRKGLARALRRFDAYQLAKYNRDVAVKITDVMGLCHPRPANDAQAAQWKALFAGTLAPADTWETGISASKGNAEAKRETWTRLLTEQKLGYLALLRNLRNMVQDGVDLPLIHAAILARKGASRVLPFRYVAAARAVPQLEGFLDEALIASIAGAPKMPGTTLALIDVSGSMDQKLSGKSDLSRLDAAATLASVLPCEHLRLFTFSDSTVEIPARRGMAGIDAIRYSQHHSGTELMQAVRRLAGLPGDRLIVLTDEQAATYGRMHGSPMETWPLPPRCYMVNVASARNGIGYGPRWLHLDGFSEQVIRWLAEYEREVPLA